MLALSTTQKGQVLRCPSANITLNRYYEVVVLVVVLVDVLVVVVVVVEVVVDVVVVVDVEVLVEVVNGTPTQVVPLYTIKKFFAVSKKNAPVLTSSDAVGLVVAVLISPPSFWKCVAPMIVS